MCQLSEKSQSPHQADGVAVPASKGGIGELFRDYGEQYIASRKPDLRTIQLIRSMRVCRTPALGGKIIKCCNCRDERYIYFSCGNSHCPICQGDKRQNWQERVEEKLLKVPYCHITFTLPHELNGLCRLQPTAIYNMLFRSAWKTLKKLCAQEKFLGALPGMTAVLHTWGSDLKHHVHVHCLVTFGGFDEKTQQWKWPKHKEKLVDFRPLRNVFRDLFLDALKKWMSAVDHGYHQSYEDLTAAIRQKTWVVNHQPPTADVDLISTYLARYICRIGISDDRLSYDKKSQQVTLEFNNYRKQEKGKAAPKAYRHLTPLYWDKNKSDVFRFVRR